MERIVERFHSQAIADQPQPAPHWIPEAERENAVEAVYRLGAPLVVAGEDDFGVAVRLEAMAPLFQIGAPRSMQLSLKLVF